MTETSLFIKHSVRQMSVGQMYVGEIPVCRHNGFQPKDMAPLNATRKLKTILFLEKHIVLKTCNQ